MVSEKIRGPPRTSIQTRSTFACLRDGQRQLGPARALEKGTAVQGGDWSLDHRTSFWQMGEKWRFNFEGSGFPRGERRNAAREKARI